MGAMIRKQALGGRDNVIVTVLTGDVKEGGTKNDVMIRFTDTGGKVSKIIKLDNNFKHDFKPGRTDEFELSEIGENIGEISAIEIWQEGILDDGLFLNVVFVHRVKTGTKHVFPLHRWIPKDDKLCIREFDSCLPQNEADPQRRRRELERKRLTYIPDVKAEGILVQCSELPPEQNLSTNYKEDLKARERRLYDIATRQVTRSPKWKTVADIKKMYTRNIFKMPMPAAEDLYLCDEYFGEQRLAGCNPLQIRLCTSIPSKFAVTPEMIEPFLEGKTLQDAIERKKIFLTDSAVLKDLQMETTDLKLVAPFGLFYLTDAVTLLPIAIQLQQDPADDNPVFLPSDPPFTWTLVKMWYNLADAAVHQGKAHLGFTHLVAESICLVTHRQLSPSHPVFRLLAPHFHYLIAMNHLSRDLLISPGGYIDQIMTMGRFGIVDIIRRTLPNWRMNVDGTLPVDIKERGVGPDVLPHYPYRDDALAIYDVIKDYVQAVVKGNYDSEETLVEDEELQAWAADLTKPFPEGGVGLQGVPGNGKISNIEDLVDILTVTIFLSSVQHAAVNFGQYEQYGFPAVYPSLLNGHPPMTKAALTDADILQALPKKEIMAVSMLLFTIFSSKDGKSLGDFEVQYAYDDIAQKALKRFKDDLRKARKSFLERNQNRRFSYDILDPEMIPNSTSI